MGFGAPSMPEAEPVPSVPQADDPGALEIERNAIKKSKKQNGYSKHLLSGHAGDTSDAGTAKKSLVG